MLNKIMAIFLKVFLKKIIVEDWKMWHGGKVRILECRRSRFKFHLYHLLAICRQQIIQLPELWFLENGYKNNFASLPFNLASKFKIPKGSFLSFPILFPFLVVSVTPMASHIIYAQAPPRILSLTHISPLICRYMCPTANLATPLGCCKWNPNATPPVSSMALFQPSQPQATGSLPMPFHKPKTSALSLPASFPCPQYSIHQQFYQVFLLISTEYVLFSPSPWISYYYKLSSFLTFDILLTRLPVFIFATSFQIHFPPNIQSDLGKQKFSSVTVIYFKELSNSSLLSWWRPKSHPRPTNFNLFLFLQLPFSLFSLFLWTPVSLDILFFKWTLFLLATGPLHTQFSLEH